MKKKKWENKLAQGIRNHIDDKRFNNFYSYIKQFIFYLQAKTIREVCEKVRVSEKAVNLKMNQTRLEHSNDMWAIGWNAAVLELNKKLDEIIKESEGRKEAK